MKRAIVALLAAFSFNALAVDAASLLLPSPLSIVLAYNTYVKDSKKVYYIRVQIQARDFEQAKKQAFRLASEQVAGTVILSESELRNSRLTRDEIITYSSGLIDEYKIVDRFDGPNFVKLTVDIWITESVMAQRLLAKSATERGVDGSALSTRVESVLDEGQRGDAVIRAVMRDYPLRAFRIKLTGNPDIQINYKRDTIISVEFDVSLDEKFVNALNEAATLTGVKVCTKLWGCPSSPPYWVMDGGFYDSTKLDIVDNHVATSYTRILVELQDTNGQAIKRDCYPLNMQGFYSRSINGRFEGVHFNAKHVYRARAFIDLGQNTKAMSNSQNIRVEIVTNSQCRPV